MGPAARQQYVVPGDGRFVINTLIDEPVSQPVTVTMNWKVSR